MASSRTAPARSRTASRATKPSALEAWRERALAVPGEVLSASVPLGVLLDEAAIAAAFFRRRWRATADHAGLESAANASFTAAAGRVLVELARAVDEADTAYRAMPARPPGPAVRGRHVLQELLATLTWHLDDGDDAPARRQLADLRATRTRIGRSATALATALEATARLAEPYRAALTGLGGFDSRQISEAKQLAAAVRARAPRAQPEERREALALRNKLVALLRDRLATVRAAARFVFRDRPEIIREITSAHERARRTRSRAKKA